ncbi:MBL fold metallo-hydrolase [Mucilaginibacter sp. R-33]|uniref:MBL fold metallo-hydrolase n=1 Tax=unclassified Mucilaginibacter TaxID=2617802 RepID=UPI003CE94A9F
MEPISSLPGDIRITATPAQHRSNRTYNQENKTLWASYVLQIGNYRLFYSGDGGYCPHFKKIGQQFGPFDLAFLECGQYSPNWPWSHLWLGQPAQAAADLAQPIHWAKFVEANQSWNEPIKRLVPAAKLWGIELNVPRIGEPYTLGGSLKQDEILNNRINIQYFLIFENAMFCFYCTIFSKFQALEHHILDHFI